MLAIGALLGLVGGIVALLAVPATGDAETHGLVRMSFLLPVAMFVGWWLVGPGIRVASAVTDPVRDAAHDALADRMRNLESTFDAAARPAAGRQAHIDSDHDGFRSSLRPAHAMDRMSMEALFGVHRPVGPSTGQAAAAADDQRAAE